MNFYTFLQILIVSIAATSAMTLFSYVISSRYRKIYREPVLLSNLLVQMKVDLSVISKKIIGWLVHFSVGFIFVFVYHLLWLYNILDLSAVNAFYLGIASGLIGVFCWAVMLKIAKYTYSVHFKGYYFQMFISRIIFALYAATVYYILLTVFLTANLNFSVQHRLSKDINKKEVKHI
ncbi:hypothetical protein CLU83_1961 [Flavobacterium sp. 1]|uniref:hypothetical protein n=1 Tax=Flavobacterium sp. 1 TaxID=2035200 RepID=UPI000C23E930|nr:hypothetical protein [Flavobacterium sp. 1]PJJ08675.1 hypothetical protein CLU83_1961 [Flavobacterium sp. 1]